MIMSSTPKSSVSLSSVPGKINNYHQEQNICLYEKNQNLVNQARYEKKSKESAGMAKNVCDCQWTI